MGPQRVLQAALVVIGATSSIEASPASPVSSIAHAERVALIDLGPSHPDDIAVRQRIEQLIVRAKLEPVIGDGVEDALAGESADRDANPLAIAMESAKLAFGSLDCAKTSTAAHTAIAIAAGRQAAGVATPELARAWSLILLCADRGNETDVAMLSAARLRAVGGSPDVPANVMTKYPDIDAIGGQDRIPIEITAAAGTNVWIDHHLVGPAPAKTVVSPGVHVIAAGTGTIRGAREVAITPGPQNQTPIALETVDAKGAWTEVALRVAGWHGKVPAATELAWVLTRVQARVALVRYGDTVEAWGQAGRAEPPHRLGAEDGVGKLDEVSRLLQLVADRVQAWTDRAPDPDAPLLLETARTLRERQNEPTQWWVYAAIAGAIAGAALIVYVHDSASNVQHVELHYP